jgi:hypothetical protein
MTYGFRPENWPAFQSELEKREITVADIEKVEIRPSAEADVSSESTHRLVDVTVTLRSGRTESWRQSQEAA